MSWTAAHAEAIIAAADARETLDLNSFERIDVFEALVHDGVKLMFRPLDSAGCYEPRRPTASPGVLVNSQHPLALQRYTAAHEYAHHIFEHGGNVARDGESRRQRADATHEERLADAFAAWFLMPPEAVRRALDRLGLQYPTGPKDAYALALRLGVSYTAVCVHLPSLKLGTAPITGAWADLTLKQVKQELSVAPPIGGWHNDVWELTAADASALVVVRAGDRLLLDVPKGALLTVAKDLLVSELPPIDLLSRGRLCIDVADVATIGPRTFTVEDSDGSPIDFTVWVEQPHRGRYFSRGLVA